MDAKRCSECGTAFTPRTATAKTCGAVCRQQRRRKSALQWQRTNSARYHAYQRYYQTLSQRFNTMHAVGTWVAWNGRLYRVAQLRGLWAARRHDQERVFMHTGYDLEWGSETAIVELPLKLGQSLEALWI